MSGLVQEFIKAKNIDTEKECYSSYLDKYCSYLEERVVALQKENARLKKWKLVAENYIEWLPKPFLHAISYVTNQEFIDKLKEEEEG